MTRHFPALGDIAKARAAQSVKRLAIFTTHPIQYQAPWFRALAESPQLESHVFFSYIPTPVEQGVGFGRAFQWDTPLQHGYASSVLRSYRLPKSVPRFAQVVTRSVRQSLRDFGASAALILGWHEISMLQAVTACRSLGVPIILRGESNALRDRPSYTRALHKALFAQCDAFLAIGRSNMQLYRQSNVPDSRIRTAPYFVDNHHFLSENARLRPQRAAIREEWAISLDAICFAFVGKLEPKKRVIDFIDAICLASARNKNIHGLVVGSGELLNAAQERARTSPSAVSFAGFVNQSQIARAYVAADALVLPSDYGETWGLVVNEAMSCALPAIVSDRVGCAQDLIQDGVTGETFQYGNVEALAGIMTRWAADPQYIAEMGRAAQSLVQQECSISNAVAGIVELVDKVVCSRHEP